jgi:hypothetical protein
MHILHSSSIVPECRSVPRSSPNKSPAVLEYVCCATDSLHSLLKKLAARCVLYEYDNEGAGGGHLLEFCGFGSILGIFCSLSYSTWCVLTALINAEGLDALADCSWPLVGSRAAERLPAACFAIIVLSLILERHQSYNIPENASLENGAIDRRV